MKKIIFALGLIGLCSAPATLACNEDCLRDKAEQASGTEFPGYLSWKYCDSIRNEFMTSSMKSLQTYADSRLDMNYRKSMRNIKDYLGQRKDWLSECDGYMQATNRGRVFNDDKTTNTIFTAMDEVNTELDSLLSGVTYAGQESDTAVASQKFQQLFTQVENHKNRLLLKGQMITSR
ncbi:hypothetical protein [Simiduia agarivorans]|uniref:Lysozyme inhibitor LprI N-terminal domain-containing protein n=1 Tax=Simiduia agarivorans (strain DSM 21679 / JCM 13881 / BCRC 17597 / SA1) TaxID=1117647 RepID=K4KUH4_SIMAS|nr:hypothetical protein [Simiduia agarivorans]AFU97612.2 hypothetical protein M5M_01965 [Simiduia agarivorans SA1 = DSM 21679]